MTIHDKHPCITVYHADSNKKLYQSEWVAYGEVKALAFREAWNIEISRAAGIVWCVDYESPIKTYDKEVKVRTYEDT